MNSCENPPIAPTRNRNRNNISIKNYKWSTEEDIKLSQIINSSTKINWNEIAQHFPGKTPQQILERWTKVLDPTLLKGSWTRHEDETIINFVRHSGTKSWTKLAELLPGRIGKQCRERWINHLDPHLEKGPWTLEEDNLLIKLHAEFGNHWVKISSFLPQRSDNSIKNRWNSTLSKRNNFESKDNIPLPLLNDEKNTLNVAIYSPLLPSNSPYILHSPISKFGLSNSWIESSLLSPNRKFSVPKLSLLENRAELINLISKQ